uniref:Major capsid protein L1 n=1 Tax=Bat papillomavirus TaxID=2004707 RepID=A0A2Z2JIZ6_9PAPI|nr:L1 [Bat papillomavirus]
MAVWLPASNKFYLPPKPITRVLSTDEYVQRTDLFYHAGTERLLTVGHPYYDVFDNGKQDKLNIPKVSPNQYRVFRLKFADPNNFAFADTSVFNPETERLVWGIRAIEVGRGQPLGVSVTGHPYFNKESDVENPVINYDNGHEQEIDNRRNQAFDSKQTQLFIIGAKPATGEHWQKALNCAADQQDRQNDCPPIELVNTVIEDGDMIDIGLGNLDFAQLQENKSEAPLDIVQSICKYPDYLKMNEDMYGDPLFFYVRREQLYARHFFNRAGRVAEEIVPKNLYFPADQAKTIASSVYGMTPSGSLVSTESQVFNRPYFLQRSAGQNNGILWGNELFVTLADNTRGTTFSINIATGGAKPETFKGNKFNEYLRHVEEFQISCILQLCKVSLTPENLAFIHTMDPSIIDRWHLAVNQPTNQILDEYRYIKSLATKCPDAAAAENKPVDPYEKKKFWVVDLSEHMTEQLDQTALGRKFLYQTGTGRRTVRRSGTRVVRKRTIRSTSKGSAKRRRT